MAKQVVNVGTVANDNTGDDIRTGGQKIMGNFNEIYSAIGDGTVLATIPKSTDGTILNIIALTQAQYDALSPPVSTTLYVIIG